ncbi:hypothetical protein AcV5_009106 [Taiwanofungus camphoratus]|nr:hypothetical protein AcV5_009106 [Antrodia cinnamomea]KAI0924392.1 hypothetical protein AcW2_005280 [Antrodia cinnamomea]
MTCNQNLASQTGRFIPIYTPGNERVNLDPHTWAFNFGRRVCPGQHFADLTMFMAMASILATYDILPELDADGKLVLPKWSLPRAFLAIRYPSFPGLKLL